MIPRTLIAGLCALAVLAPVAGAGDAELTKIKVVFLPAEPAVLAAYAKHRGMLRKQGIDAELVPGNDPAVNTAALLSGAVQFGGAQTVGAALFKSRNAPVKVVAAGALYDPKNPTSGLVAAKGRSIKRARDLVGKTILIDSPNTIAHIGVLEWLKKGGVSQDDVKIQFLPFADMLALLSSGKADAAFMPEPYLTIAQQQGLKIAAYPFGAVCSKVCVITFFLARSDVDTNVVARFRNAIQNAAVWANQPKNDPASAKILGKYVTIDAKVAAKMKRTRFGPRLRLGLAQPWIDAAIEFGLLPPSFKASDLVK